MCMCMCMCVCVCVNVCVFVCFACLFVCLFVPWIWYGVMPVNKQLNDKERVAAALENQNLLAVVDKCLAPKTQ